MTRVRMLAPLVLAALLGACDNESLMPPTENPGLVHPMFARYVSFGNSITAGFQSGGINDSTQRESYAALLAAAMGTEFNIPLLNFPGCPPPLTNVFTQSVVGDPGPLGCALRDPDVPEHLNNVAIPGSEVIDTFAPLGPGNSSNTLTTIMGGGQSQLANAARVLPTFVTVWIGANDVLGAILDPTNPGNPAEVTSPTDFASRYAALTDSLDAFGSIEGAVLIGVPHAVLAPYLSQGRVWKGFELLFDAATQPLNALDVTNACLSFAEIPGTNDTAWVSIPFAVGGPALGLARARVDSVQGGLLAPGDLETVVLDCADDAQAVTVTEILNMFGAVTQYNAAIEAEADARNWLFIDPNPLLIQIRGDTAAARPFPAFPGTVMDPTISVTQPFGSAFSRDGIHPSGSGHAVITGLLLQAINAAYGTSIPAGN